MRKASFILIFMVGVASYGQELFLLSKYQTDFKLAENTYSKGLRLEHKKMLIDITSSIESNKTYFFLLHYNVSKKVFLQYNIITKRKTRSHKQTITLGLKLF